MKKIFTLAAAVLASMAMMAVDPDFESQDWTKDVTVFSDVFKAYTAEGITLSATATAWSGNLSGHNYVALGSQDFSGTANNMQIVATSQIDSVAILWAVNGTSASNIAWAAWEKNVTPNEKLADNYYGTTANVTSTKVWENAVWQTIDLSQLEAYSLMIARQIKKAKKVSDGSTISNFGANQTVNVLGLKVWFHPTKTIVNTTETLTAVRINGQQMPADALAALIANHSYDLLDEFTEAPEISFTKHTVITYDDSSSKEKDDIINVTASEASAGIWHAATTIGGVVYAVNAVKPETYTVTYYDGEAIIGTETVKAGENAELYDELANQPMREFVAWYTDAAMQHEVAALGGWTISENKNYYGKWNKAYATSLNIEQYILDNGMNNKDENNIGEIFQAVLDGAHYGYENINALDSLNDAKGELRNYAFLGLKIKKTAGYISFNLAQGSTVKIRFGNVGKAFTIKVNGADSDQATTDLANTSVASDKVFTYTASDADALIQIYGCADNKTLVIKQIMINEEIAAVTLPSSPTAINNTEAEVKAVKFFRNGQMFIEKNGVIYNAQGAIVK